MGENTIMEQDEAQQELYNPQKRILYTFFIFLPQFGEPGITEQGKLPYFRNPQLPFYRCVRPQR